MRSRIAVALLLVLNCATLAFAQLQRLGIPTHSFNLAPSGATRATHEVEAFCFNEERTGPKEALTPYVFAAAGEDRAFVRFGSGKRMPLMEAVAAKKIEIEGHKNTSYTSHFGLRFKNNTSEEVSIEIGAPLVTSHEPSPERVHPDILTTLTAKTSEATQDHVWEVQALYDALSQLGYDVGSSREEASAAISAFQRSANLPADGVLGRQTSAAVRERATEIAASLSALPRPLDQGRPQHLTLREGVKELQTQYRLPPTGVFDAATAKIAAKQRAESEDIQRIASKLVAPPRVGMRQSDRPAEVRAYEQTSPLSTMMLVRRGASDELWTASPLDGFTHRVLAENPVAEFDRASVNLVSSVPSHEGAWVRVGQPRGGNVSVAIAGKAISIDEGRLRSFLRGQSASLAEIDKLLDGHTSSGPPLSLVFAPSPLEQSTSHAEDLTRQLAIAVRRSYSGKFVSHWANDIGEGLLNSRLLPEVRGGASLAFARDDGVLFNKKIDAIVPDMETAGIRAVAVGEVNEKTAKTPIVVLLGHLDDNYRRALEKLADEGNLDGTLVAKVSCGMAGEEAYNSGFIQRSGASGILFFHDEINPNFAAEVLLDLTKRARAQTTPRNLVLLWNDCVRAVAERHSNSADDHRDVLKMLDPYVQVSERTPVSDEVAA